MEFEALRRWPDVEAENLFAVDASDRLILDEAAEALATAKPGEVVVVGDRYGALTLGALEQLGLLAGEVGPDAAGGSIRVHQDAISGEQALTANARSVGADLSAFRILPLGIEQHPAELFNGSRVVLLQLPRALDALEEIVAAIAANAEPEVQIFAGGRIKHMTPAMNSVFAASFDTVEVSLARQKSRVLRVRAPHTRGQHGNNGDGVTEASGNAAALPEALKSWPRLEQHRDVGLTVAAHGAAFAAGSIDIGTRFLLGHLAEAAPGARTAIDLGCGTGILATSLAVHRPQLRVLASDQSAAAVASARATADANGVGDRVKVVRDDGLSRQPDGSADLIVLNPPFHVGATVHAGIALKLFEHAARVLAPGGELWCVWNSHLGYVPALRSIVGPTRQIARNTKFTITASTRA